MCDCSVLTIGANLGTALEILLDVIPTLEDVSDRVHICLALV